ncbi:unnamed protein product, partial [Hydatigera taeniaeformis]|uniref:USP domain-containing protein n=1 Tax=Hydatigena taeniaeformis TaxID=6205 RepID=A0A0R3XCN7_HYDTA
LPGVKTVPVPLISLDSIDRARSRRKTRVVSTSSSTGVNPSREPKRGLKIDQGRPEPHLIKTPSKTYSRCVNIMTANPNATPWSTGPPDSPFRGQKSSWIQSKMKKNWQILEQPLKSSVSNEVSKSFSAGTVTVEVSEKSELTSSHSMEKKIIATSGNNDDSPVSKPQNSRSLTKSRSQSSSHTPSFYGEVWRPKLFRQTPKRSKSSASEVMENANPSKASVEVSLTHTPTLPSPIKDSFQLSRYHKKENSSNSSPKSDEDGENCADNSPTPCEALKLTRDGRNPVVYGKWFDFNDDVVTEVSCENFKHVFEGVECAYMLFYKRIGQSVT